VGYPAFDEQHKELLALFQQACDCVEDDSVTGTGRFFDILHDLVDYTTRHFRAEEALLRESNYPWLNEHRAEHLKYELRLTEFLIAANCGDIDKESLRGYLADWWSKHILESDKRYGDFLNAGHR
jgi:hemerythrin-like metal-binding protein